MRLKMRILLFCVLLLFGREMRGYHVASEQPDFSFKENITQSRPLILYSCEVWRGVNSVESFRYESVALIAEGDTIPLQLLDSCYGNFHVQWLFQPQRAMSNDKEYTFNVNLGSNSLYSSNVFYYMLNTQIRTTPDKRPPEIRGKPTLDETRDSIYNPFVNVFISLHAFDETPMLVRAIYTDRITGEKQKAYFHLDDAQLDVGSELCAGILDLNTAHTYLLEITVFDQAGNQSIPFVFSDEVRFEKDGRYNYSEAKRQQADSKMVIIIAVSLLIALGGLFIAVRRWSGKGKHTTENSDHTES